MEERHGEFYAPPTAEDRVGPERASGRRAVAATASLAVTIVGGIGLWAQTFRWLVSGEPALAGVGAPVATALLGVGVFVVGPWLFGRELPATWLGRDTTRPWTLRDAWQLSRASSRAKPDRVFEVLDRFQGRERPITRQGRIADENLLEHVRRTGKAVRVRVFSVQLLVFTPVLVLPLGFALFPDVLLSLIESTMAGTILWAAVFVVGYGVSAASMRSWCTWYRDEVLSYRAPPRPPQPMPDVSTA